MVVGCGSSQNKFSGESHKDKIPRFESNFYEIQIPNQKWNNFVFNYSSKYVDLFINGKLTRTFYFKENIPDYHVGDVVTTGSENGLSGAIANIRYYQKKLTSREITAFYNIFKKKNPPTNNL